MRNTRQRSAIYGVLAEGDHPLTIDELHDGALKRVKRLGIATVYRTVKALIDRGEIVPVEVAGAPTRYEASGKGHHHHFHCRTCGKVYEIRGCARAIEALAPAGFTTEAHDVTLTGQCDSCSRRTERARR